MASIYQPKPADVLCGRGKRSFGHEGNYIFRQLVVEHANIYKMAPTKKEKTQVVMLVAKAIIARGGRFLTPHDTGSDGSAPCWKDGGLKHGKRKAGHALCDALRGRMSFVHLRKAQLRTDDEVRAKPAQQAQAQHIDQIKDLPLETITSSDLSVSQTYPSVEPSNQWMTARMDVELANYLRNLFSFQKEQRRNPAASVNILSSVPS